MHDVLILILNACEFCCRKARQFIPCPYFSAQVRTLFVSGLPMDAKPRELYLLFRAYKVSRFSDVEVGGTVVSLLPCFYPFYAPP